MATAVGVLDEPVKPGYDWKLSLKAAGKMALLAAAGVFLSDQTGLTAFVVAHLPPAYAALGQIVLASVFAWLRNLIVNRNK